MPRRRRFLSARGRLSSPDCRPPPSCRPRLGSVAAEQGFRERWGGVVPPDSPVPQFGVCPDQRPVDRAFGGDVGFLPPQKALVDGHLGRCGAGGNRTVPRPRTSNLLSGYRRWSGRVFECPAVTASDLQWPAFDALSPPRPPFCRPLQARRRGPDQERRSPGGWAWAGGRAEHECSWCRPIVASLNSLQRADSPTRSTSDASTRCKLTPIASRWPPDETHAATRSTTCARTWPRGWSRR